MNNIKKYRKSKSLTQVELANKIGITQAYVSILENGVGDLNHGLVNKIAEILNVSPANLIILSEGSLKDAVGRTIKNMTSDQLMKILDYAKMVRSYGGREKL